MENNQKSQLDSLLENVDFIIRSNTDTTKILKDICILLTSQVEYYHWVGFYLTGTESERVLKLGPYIGAPTEHTRIKFGEGICGQVAEKNETMVIGDVNAESNYLSCSSDVKSEIVVPVIKDGKMHAQIDIDSHDLDPFGEFDHLLLESIAKKLAPLF